MLRPTRAGACLGEHFFPQKICPRRIICRGKTVGVPRHDQHRPPSGSSSCRIRVNIRRGPPPLRMIRIRQEDSEKRSYSSFNSFWARGGTPRHTRYWLLYELRVDEDCAPVETKKARRRRARRKDLTRHAFLRATTLCVHFCVGGDSHPQSFVLTIHEPRRNSSQEEHEH